MGRLWWTDTEVMFAEERTGTAMESTAIRNGSADFTELCYVHCTKTNPKAWSYLSYQVFLQLQPDQNRKNSQTTGSPLC
ncbi:UNVERIFIED_CONTAM: hypothetical protein PYX00_003575 [Menopon gallinae]|uniref:Uncharacterized protein n=1 Tax=Menopon gallinae TaxID=328185 RepID=A0AAW2I294_9NEOP